MLTRADWLSLSRVPISFAILVFYDSAQTDPQWTVIGLLVIAVLSDFLDGREARRMGTVSRRGYIFDGLGDKAVYVSLYLILFLEQVLPILLCHLLILREIALYAFRCLITSEDVYKKHRLYSLLHAWLIRLGVLLFFLRDTWPSLPLPILALQGLFAFGAAFSLYGIFLMMKAVLAED
jgi:phosphatidylglycerophosphate synthase